MRFKSMATQTVHCLVGVCVLLGTIQLVLGAKILMKSTQFVSHMLEQISLGEELASRGHEVYVAFGSRFSGIASVEERGMKTLTYKFPDDAIYGASDEVQKRVAEIVFGPGKDKSGLAGSLANKLIYDDCAYMMADEAFLSKVRRLEFDLAIVEPFFMGQCNLILPKYIGLRFVSNAALFSPWHIRIPALPSFANFMSVWTDLTDITLISRLRNLLTYVAFDNIVSSFAPANNTLLRRYAPEYQSWNDLLRQSELFLVGRDYHLGAPIPEMPNYISVAGLTTAKPKKLTKDLEDLADKSNGIILLSFGTNTHYFPKEVIVRFLEAFSNLNQTVLAKFFIPDGVNVPENVKVFSWLPQNDILGHPKTKLFITHGGLNGLHEALYHAVPVIGFPMFAEQPENCHRAYKKGFGLEMKIQDFTSHQLLLNIQEMLNNPKYKNSISKASAVFRDQPMNAREKGAFWVEHVIRHGGNHLRIPGMDLPLYQFLMLDVLFVIGVGVVVLILILFKSWYIFRRLFSRLAVKTKLKTN